MRLNQVLSLEAAKTAPPQVAAPAKSQGIITNWWVWISRLPVTKGKDAKPQPAAPAEAPGKNEAEKVEADSASSMPQTVRADAKKESSRLTIHASFREKSTADSAPAKAKSEGTGSRFRCILIQEGLGNFGDAFYYSREALESAAPLFEGKKVYANHPSAIDEQARPERDVRDILGHFENVELIKGEGQSHLEADVCIPLDAAFDWARALMTHALEFSQKYPDKQFIGLSINANGEAEPKPLEEVLKLAPEGAAEKLIKARDEMGISEVRVVSKIESAISCDLVTEAGAGGAILSLLEQEKTMAKKAKRESEIDQTKVANQDKEPEKHPAGAAEAAPADGDGSATPDGEHPDKAQDIKLIKQMIAKYMAKGTGGGDDSAAAEEADGMECKEEEMMMAKEAYEAYKEMGYKEDAALEAAAHTMKCAKHMQAKKEAAAGVEAEEAKAAEAFPPKKDGDADDADAKKESMKIAELTGKITLLEGELRQFKLAKVLDTMLEKSGLRFEATKAFRAMESVKTAKTEKELTNLFEAFKAGRGAEGSLPSDPYGFLSLAPEKKTLTESGAKKVVSLGDCLK